MSVFSTHYFYWEILDFKNIKISQVILRNTFFQLSFRIFGVLIFYKQLHEIVFQDSSLR